MKILLDMRAALDGYSGIPQETRLLYRGLGRLEGVKVLGLIQSGNLVVESGLPLRNGSIAAVPGSPDYIDRLSQVVSSLQQGPATHRIEYVRKTVLRMAGPASAAMAGLIGRKVRLTGFDPTNFKDFVWRSMFAKTLPVDDFEAVTSTEFRVMRLSQLSFI